MGVQPAEWLSEPFHTTINGCKRVGVRVKGDGRVIEAVELDMGDQWDFLEIAGGQINNDAWVNTGLLAASVVSIDGVPQPLNVRSKDHIRQILRKIGPRGLDALHAAFNVPGPDGRAEQKDDTDRDHQVSMGNL